VLSHRTDAEAAGDACNHHGVRVRRVVAVIGTLGVLGAGGAALAATQYPFGHGTGGCPVFPKNSPWHEDISKLPVSPRSAAYIASIGAGINLHPDFGSNLTYGIPYAVVPASQPKVAIHFTAYGDQSDKGPYPIPNGAPVEGGASSTGDRHVLVVQSGACKLYELYSAYPQANGSWNAGSGAVFNLRSTKLRPNGWTSADAAGLPIFAGLIRYDEIQRGYINHAIRFTAPQTQAGFIHPATHFASSSTNPDLPPMGLRLRLKASFDISRFPRVAKIILRAMKRYGLILADNGSPWYFQGATDPRWNDNALDSLKTVPGSAFEVVQTGPILHTG
jgi:hypothetical protein